MKYDGEMNRERESFHILESTATGTCFFRRWLIFCRALSAASWLIFSGKMRFLAASSDVPSLDCRDP